MREASQLYLLTKASLRDRWRWARQHLYSLLILGPLVFGMTYLTLDRMASYDLSLQPPTLLAQILLATACVLSIIILTLSRASREIYHLRQPQSLAEALPVQRTTHLHLALITRTGHTLMLALVLIIIRTIFRTEGISALPLSTLALFCLLVTVSEVYAALNWIHWSHQRHKPAAMLAVAVLAVTACVNGLLLTLFINPAAATMLKRSVTTTVMRPGLTWPGYFSYSSVCFFTGAIYLLTRLAHEQWRAADIDYAQRLEHGSRRTFDVTKLFSRRLSQGVAAMLARDLQLTLRTFSSAVYVAVGIALLLLILLLTLLTRGALPSAAETLGGLSDLGWMSATWLPAALLIKLTVVFAVASLAAVVPVLVHYQLPHMWLERANGATGEQVWQAKMWYARLMTLPAVLAAYIVGIVAAKFGSSDVALPLFYVLPLLAECLWLWWLVSSSVGALAFEMPDRPELGIVLMLTICLSLGVFGAVLWPMGVGIYGLGVAQVSERGKARAAYYLMTEEE